jgi:hypothetical protein
MMQLQQQMDRFEQDREQKLQQKLQPSNQDLGVSR